MKYQKIDDPESVATESLRVEARQKEELAFAAECGLEEAKGLMARDLLQGVTPTHIDSLENDAKAKRREAEVFKKAASFTEEEVSEVRKLWLHRWLEMIERNHIQHSAILKVKAELGEPTANYDSILASLDVSHDVALKSLNNMDGKKLTQAERRTAPRARK